MHICQMVIHHLVEQHQSGNIWPKPRHGNDQYRPMQIREAFFGVKSVTCVFTFVIHIIYYHIYIYICVCVLLSICCHYIVDTCYKHLQTASSCNCNSYVYAPGLRCASVQAGCEIWEAVFFFSYDGHRYSYYSNQNNQKTSKYMLLFFETSRHAQPDAVNDPP